MARLDNEEIKDGAERQGKDQECSELLAVFVYAHARLLFNAPTSLFCSCEKNELPYWAEFPLRTRVRPITYTRPSLNTILARVSSAMCFHGSQRCRFSLFLEPQKTETGDTSAAPCPSDF